MHETHNAGSTATRAVTLMAALVLTVALLVAGCDRETVTTTSQVPSTAGVTTTAAVGGGGTPSTLPAENGLTLEQVRNAECTVEFGDNGLSFTLVDGSYQSGEGGNDPDRVTVDMSEVAAFGDLNGDGVGDAAISIRVRKGNGKSGGNKDFSQYVVALVSQDGLPVQSGYHLVGAGAQVDAVTIAAGEIAVKARVPASEDASGNPKVPITMTLRMPFDGRGTLFLTSQTSETASGGLREINITSPEPGAKVTIPCILKGTITIAPFENNLVYDVYATDMTERDEGPVQVDAPSLGAPGTFEFALAPSPEVTTGRMVVTVSDISAADGSILALASIEVAVE